MTQEHKKKIGKANSGRVVSLETRKKLSESHKGISGYWLGKKRPTFQTEERKKHLSMLAKKSGLIPPYYKGEEHPSWKSGKPLCLDCNKKLKNYGRMRCHSCYFKFNKGSNHFNWQDGKSFEPYTTDWTNTLRRAIRERDFYTCQVCKEPQGDMAFDIHHIDYNKKNCNSDNLITLCRSCHMKTNYRRDYWTNYFSSL